MKNRAIEQLEQRTLLTGELDWAATFDGPAAAAQRIATDAAGNVYVAGHFSGELSLRRGLTLRSNGRNDAFVAKYAPDGRLLWGRSVGGAGDDTVGGLAVDRTGNVIVAGRFARSADFDPSRHEFILRSNGGTDAFIWKLDSGGRLVWAQSAGGKRHDAATAVTTDAKGKVFVAGFFRTSIFDGRLQLTAGRGTSALVWSLGDDGAHRFARALGGEGSIVPNTIALDHTGRVLTAGHFTGTIDFAPGKPQSLRTSAGGQDLFIARINAAGRYAGALTAGGAGDDSAAAIAIDSSNGVYITGHFSGQADFDPSDGTTLLSTDGPDVDAFIARYDSSLNLKLARRIGDAGAQRGAALAIDPAGAVYIAGVYSGSPDFDIGNGVERMTSPGPASAFLVKITAAGRFAYARTLGGTDTGGITSLAIGPGNALLAAGRFSGEIDLDPSDGVATRSASAGGSGFAVRLAQQLPSYSLSRQFGEGDLQVRAMVVDDADDLFIVGTFSGTLTFGAGAGQLQFTSQGGTDVFIGKFCNKCNITWGRVVGGPGDDSAADIVLGADGSIFVTGTFRDTADFDPGAGAHELTSAGGDDVFLLKLDAAGSFAWAQRIGDAYDDVAGAVAVAGDTVYVGATVMEMAGDLVQPKTGIYSFGESGLNWRADSPFVLEINDLIATPHRLFVAGRTTANTNAWILDTHLRTWSIRPDAAGDAHGTLKLARSSSGDIYAAGHGGLMQFTEHGAPLRTWAWEGTAAVAIDPFDNIYVAGTYEGAFDPGGDGRFVLQSAGGRDIFLLKLDPRGNLVWAGSMGGEGADHAADLAVGGSGAFIYVLGGFTDRADVDPTAGIHERTAMGLGSFLTRVVA